MHAIWSPLFIKNDVLVFFLCHEETLTSFENNDKRNIKLIFLSTRINSIEVLDLYKVHLLITLTRIF